jgi:hypothetical protein
MAELPKEITCGCSAFLLMADIKEAFISFGRGVIK